MPVNTEYMMALRVAPELAEIVQNHLVGRIELLTKFLNRRGEKSLIETFATFIGLANQVLIEECGEHPNKFKSVNMPTILGALQGGGLANGCEPAGACHCCAYRLGSIGNQPPIAISDAAYMVFNSKGFMCHAYIDHVGQTTRVCVDHARAASSSTKHRTPRK
jgi:hypothetical protein